MEINIGKIHLWPCKRCDIQLCDMSSSLSDNIKDFMSWNIYTVLIGKQLTDDLLKLKYIVRKWSIFSVKRETLSSISSCIYAHQLYTYYSIYMYICVLCIIVYIKIC